VGVQPGRARRAGLTLVAAFAAGAGQAAEGPAQALREGAFSLSLRYRFELVEDDTPRFEGRDAEASTLRTVLGYRSAELRGWSVGLTAENVSELGFEDRSGGGRPVIADPEITELLEVYGQWRREVSPGHEHRVRFGRQEIDHADQRFLGAVGWRQHHQSFDALTVQAAPGRRWRVFYAYLDRAHTISGARAPMASHFLSTAAGIAQAGELELFGLWLDYDRPEQSASSSRTVGARWTGRTPLRAELDLVSDAAVARQDELGENPADFGLGFWRLDLGVAQGAWSARAGVEVLEGDGAVAFQTPLATLHKFNGWADRFLVTPPTGLEDRYLVGTLSRGSWGGTLAYHRFAAERGGGSYGDEVDAELRWTSGWRQTFALKLARFSSDGFAADVDKWILWSSWGF
jgi:hypothetical protein